MDVEHLNVQDRPPDPRSHGEAIETETRAVAGAEAVPLKDVKDVRTQTAVVLAAGQDHVTVEEKIVLPPSTARVNRRRRRNKKTPSPK